MCVAYLPKSCSLLPIMGVAPLDQGWLTAACCGTRQAVGIAQGVLGVFGAVSGVPAGFIADHTRRDRTLFGFGIVQLGARHARGFRRSA